MNRPTFGLLFVLILHNKKILQFKRTEADLYPKSTLIFERK